MGKSNFGYGVFHDQRESLAAVLRENPAGSGKHLVISRSKFHEIGHMTPRSLIDGGKEL
jgi:diadenosine tetraphosphate (Ap4A) HIT family hydrolase